MLKRTIVVNAFLLSNQIAYAAPHISETTMSAILMCGPLDSASTNLKDCPKAIGILKNESAAGDPYADFYLAMAYSNGILVKSNDVTAFNYMLKSANGGDKAAFYYVGVSYLLGAGTPIDVENALTWLGKSAYAGDTNAQYMLGQVYSEQKYGHQNFVLSYTWYDVASIGGLASAKPMSNVIGALLSREEQLSAQSTAKKLAMELDPHNISSAGN